MTICVTNSCCDMHIHVGESSVEAKTTTDNVDIAGRKDSEMHSEDDVYSCGECEKCFSSQASLIQHALIHRIGQKCTECGRSFHSKNALFMHSVRIHRMWLTTSQQISIGSASAKSNDNAAMSSTNLQAEAETTKGDKTDISGSKDSLERHRVRHVDDIVYSCGECEKCFLSLASLNQHALTHKKCTECGRSFHSKKALLMHSVQTHRMCQTLSQQISTCVASAKSSDVNKANVNTLQSESETKTDNTVITGRKDSLKKDRESHSQDDVYLCNECEKCFSSQASLNQHAILIELDTSAQNVEEVFTTKRRY